MPEFKFNDQDHSYWRGSQRLYGVTDVINDNGLMNGTDFFTEESRDRGKAVHVACELLFWNNLDWASVDKRIFGYVVSCAEFIAETGFKPKRTEFKAYHPELGYAGTWDGDGDTAKLKGILFDLKSGVRAKWHGYQTAAYLELARVKGFNIKHRGSLYLQENGSCGKFREHTDRNDWKVFVSALNLSKARDL